MVRLDCLDGLRGLLAITVMISHIIGSIFGWTNDRAFIGAYISVVYFFMMSGFVLSYAYSKKINFIKFLLFRIARLWPLHALSTLLILCIFYYNSKNGGYVPNQDVFDIKTILKNLLFANGIYWEEFFVINAPSWSISIEFWCSLLIPLLFNRINLITKICLSVCLFVCLSVLYENGFQKSMVIAGFAMLVGCLCFELINIESFRKHIQERNFMIFIVFSLIICFIGIYSESQSRRDFLYFLAFLPLLFIDYIDRDFWLKNILSSKFFSFLGFISFPLYLLHDLVIVSGIRINNNQWLSSLLLSSVSIFIAYIYARYVDSWSYNFFKKRIKNYF